MTSGERVKALIVGSGGNAIAPAALLKRAGIEDFRIITKHDDFGGCWYQNRYPGCNTDVPISLYQLSFATSSDWGGTHGDWNELAGYLQGVARDSGLYERTDFETELLEAEWLEDEVCWKVTTNRGIYHADVLIPATGFLEEPVYPNLEGRDQFKGRIFHSSTWPEGYTGEGDRVAVLGSGSSALQIVPKMQKAAAEVIVFQRTANYILPMGKRRFTEEERAQIKADPEALKRKGDEDYVFFERSWANGFLGEAFSKENAEKQELALSYLNERVSDPELRALLTPKFGIGCKRVGVSDDYYEAVQQPNVKLIPEAAVALKENSIISKSGREFEVDTVVMATGFVFGGHVLHRIKRRDGVTVGEYQKDHPRAYKATSVAGCPNLFIASGGPNSQIWNGLATGEFVSNYVLKALEYMQANGVAAVEIKESAELEWKRQADSILDRAATVAAGCTNYSQDASGHNKAAWPGSMKNMETALKEFNPADYDVVARRETVAS